MAIAATRKVRLIASRLYQRPVRQRLSREPAESKQLSRADRTRLAHEFMLGGCVLRSKIRLWRQWWSRLVRPLSDTDCLCLAHQIDKLGPVPAIVFAERSGGDLGNAFERRASPVLAVAKDHAEAGHRRGELQIG